VSPFALPLQLKYAQRHRDQTAAPQLTLELDPHNALAHSQLGRAYLAKSMYLKQSLHIKRSLTAHPGKTLNTTAENPARDYVGRW
jgi:hypothetical protein